MKKGLFILPILGLFLLTACEKDPAPASETTSDVATSVVESSVTTSEPTSTIVETSANPSDTSSTAETSTSATETTGTDKDTGWLPAI